jgi:hypothetical protein
VFDMIGRMSRLNDTGSTARAIGHKKATARSSVAIGARAGLAERFAIGTTPLENARVAVGPDLARRGPASPADRSADLTLQYIVRIAGGDQLAQSGSGLPRIPSPDALSRCNYPHSEPAVRCSIAEGDR